MGKRYSLVARSSLAAVAAIAGMLISAANAEPKKPARSEDGKYYDKDDVPTYNISEGGKVDWYTYSGYRRYHAECHVCHGPDGMGSSYAPALVDSAKNLTYQQFTEIVVQGRQNVTASAHNVMPSFGTNMNVMCYLDDIYVYLRARADDALGRVRPNEREQKPEAAVAAEKSCIGG